MYKRPSRRSKKHEVTRPNLIPILDAVFIFIFFLLMSANFVKIFEISSDVPIVSDAEPPKNQKPLALTLKVDNESIRAYVGVPSRRVRSFKRISRGKYDLESLHNWLITIKKKNKKEKSVILEPLIDLTYEEIVNIMDSVRLLRNTDPDIYRKTKSGLDEKVRELFDNIVFGNIRS